MTKAEKQAVIARYEAAYLQVHARDAQVIQKGGWYNIASEGRPSPRTGFRFEKLVQMTERMEAVAADPEEVRRMRALSKLR